MPVFSGETAKTGADVRYLYDAAHIHLSGVVLCPILCPAERLFFCRSFENVRPGVVRAHTWLYTHQAHQAAASVAFIRLGGFRGPIAGRSRGRCCSRGAGAVM